MSSAVYSPNLASAQQGLRAALHPRSVAVIGATDRPGSVGASVMENVLRTGFEGTIVPINPNRAEVFGRTVASNIGEIATPIDLAVVCTPAQTVPEIVRQCGETGVGAVLVLSAGFRESGRCGMEMEKQVRAELERFPSMRFLGPNCVGLIVPAIGLNASFCRGETCTGGLALLSQSGALCTAIVGWAREKRLGFSHVVSVGNMMDVGFGDLLDYLAEDSSTTSVALYVEGITDASRFLAAARRCVSRKPVIVYKAGRNASGSQAARSHTGAMAGEDSVYQAVLDECGLIRVSRLDDLFATIELLERRNGRPFDGERLAVITNAGGAAVVAADAVVAGKGKLATLSATTLSELDASLPSNWSRTNPIDVIGDAPAQRIASATSKVLRDDGVDAALVIVTPQAMTDMAEAARAVAAVAATQSKPILATWMGGNLAREGADILQAAGIPTYATPEPAVDAFLHLAAYGHASAIVKNSFELGQLVPACRESALRVHCNDFLSGRSGLMSEKDSKELFHLCGMPVVETLVARFPGEAVGAAEELGYPVVLKVLSPGLSHKADIGGVRLNLESAAAVQAAFVAVHDSLRRLRPEAVFTGVTVQPMLDRSSGIEIIVGARRDPTFGPVVLVGAGGAGVEVLNDRAIGLTPVDRTKAMALIRSLRISPMLGAFRGRPPLMVDPLADIVVSMSRLIEEQSNLQEAEANPVLVTTERAIVLDARAILHGQPPAGKTECGKFPRSDGEAVPPCLDMNAGDQNRSGSQS